jgi:hypothetical protein
VPKALSPGRVFPKRSIEQMKARVPRLARVSATLAVALAAALWAGACEKHPTAPSTSLTFDNNGVSSLSYAESCVAAGNCRQLVVELQAKYGRPRNPEEIFGITRRVAWALRRQGGGLLIKNGGNNTIRYQNKSFSLCRIAFPNGHIWKVMTSCGDGAAGPGWADNGFVNPNLYVPAIDPGE